MFILALVYKCAFLHYLNQFSYSRLPTHRPLQDIWPLGIRQYGRELDRAPPLHKKSREWKEWGGRTHWLCMFGACARRGCQGGKKTRKKIKEHTSYEEHWVMNGSVELARCTPETNRTLDVNYTRIKRKKLKEQDKDFSRRRPNRQIPPPNIQTPPLNSKSLPRWGLV